MLKLGVEVEHMYTKALVVELTFLAYMSFLLWVSSHLSDLKSLEIELCLCQLEDIHVKQFKRILEIKLKYLEHLMGRRGSKGYTNVFLS